MITGSKTDIDNRDEFYTPIEVVKEHFELTEKYLGLDNNTKLFTCFGDNNIYTKVLSEMGYDVIEYDIFEDSLAKEKGERVLIDNPPFSKASKIRKALDGRGIKYSLLGSGTWFPKTEICGAILFKEPRKTYHNGIDVLTTIFQNFDNNIYSEYSRSLPNKYSPAFIAVNLDKGVYDAEEFRKVMK